MPVDPILLRNTAAWLRKAEQDLERVERCLAHEPPDAELCLGFRGERETHALFLAQDLVHHLVVAVADNGLAGLHLRDSAPDRVCKNRPNRLLRKKLQVSARRRQFGVWKPLDHLVKVVAKRRHFRNKP